MGRARGANAKLALGFESTYGTVPGSGFMPLPFSESNLGAEQSLIEDDQLGNGREKFDPVYDVINNDGNVTVGVDLRNFGHWLKLLLGAPSTSGSSDPYTHSFTSGAASVPSASIETQMPDVPSYEMNYGLRGNSCQISMQRSGLLSAQIGLVGKGSSARTSTTGAGSLAAALAVSRFRQATGSITREGSTLASIVSAEVSFTNNLDKVETIQADGEIEDADPAQFMVSGNLVSRYADFTLHSDATNKSPVALTFGWSLGTGKSLVFTLPRVFLQRTKTPISGPNGVQASTNFMASGADAAAMTAVLTNDVDSYS